MRSYSSHSLFVLPSYSASAFSSCVTLATPLPNTAQQRERQRGEGSNWKKITLAKDSPTLGTPFFTTMMTSSASSSRFTCERACPTTRHTIRDKGKGRATSPDLLPSYKDQSQAEKGKHKSDRSSQDSSLSFVMEASHSPEDHFLPSTSSDEELLTTPPKLSNSASLQTLPYMSTESAGFRAGGATIDPPWLEESSIDLGDPFTFAPFDSDQDHQSQPPLRAKGANISSNMATGRRPYQSGVAHLALQESEPGRMSRIDRASILSGLRTSTPHLQPDIIPETVSRLFKNSSSISHIALTVSFFLFPSFSPPF